MLELIYVVDSFELLDSPFGFVVYPSARLATMHFSRKVTDLLNSLVREEYSCLCSLLMLIRANVSILKCVLNLYKQTSSHADSAFSYFPKGNVHILIIMNGLLSIRRAWNCCYHNVEKNNINKYRCHEKCYIWAKRGREEILTRT